MWPCQHNVGTPNVAWMRCRQCKHWFMVQRLVWQPGPWFQPVRISGFFPLVFQPTPQLGRGLLAAPRAVRRHLTTCTTRNASGQRRVRGKGMARCCELSVQQLLVKWGRRQQATGETDVTRVRESDIGCHARRGSRWQGATSRPVATHWNNRRTQLRTEDKWRQFPMHSTLTS